MNLFKSFLLSLLISFSLIIPSVSLAVDTNPQAFIATVNFENPRIVSQDKNNFKIAFGISNRQIIQTGVKYGVQLISEGGKYVADEKVYDEALTLGENTTEKREITYTAPTSLSGSYTLYLVANNESSFPFAMISLGKVKLTASTKGVEIMNDSCYLQVEGEKGAPHYTLVQNVDISAKESLKLTCTAVNNTSTQVSMTPFFETRYFSSYGKLAKQVGGDFTAVTFQKNEKKTFSLILPKGDAPQFYNLKLALINNNASSNNVSAKYIIRGVNGIIYQLSLDKDYYKAGDKGEISILWSASAGNFPRSGVKGGSLPTVSLSAKIINDKYRECVDPIEQALVRDSQNPQTKIAFEAKTTCTNPHISASLIDSEGNVLDQKDFSFKSSSAYNANPISKKALIAIIIVLLAILGIGFYMKKKKNSNVTI